MIMQPPAYKPTKGFPRRTFKGLAGLSIALGIAIIIIGIAEVIYSVNITKECARRDMDFMEMDDIEYPNKQWREKRSHRGDRHRRPEFGQVRDHHDSSSSDSMEHDPHMQWLNDVMEGVSMEERCEIFSCAAAMAALTYAGCGVIFIVTGSLGVGAARTMVAHRQSGLKTGFIVMNILNVLGFAPAVFLIGAVIAKAAPVVIQKDDYYLGHVITGQMIAFIGMVLTIISLVSACISCCCAPTEEHVKVFAMPAAPFKHQAPAVLAPGQLQVDEKAQLVANEVSEA